MVEHLSHLGEVELSRLVGSEGHGRHLGHAVARHNHQRVGGVGHLGERHTEIDEGLVTVTLK